MLLLVGDNQSTAVVWHIRHSEELKRKLGVCLWAKLPFCWNTDFVVVRLLVFFCCLLTQRIFVPDPSSERRERKVRHVTYILHTCRNNAVRHTREGACATLCKFCF